jgi:DNA polymerase-1
MRFREVFVSKPNFQFIIADYDQIELRLLAYYSRDLNLLTAFENGIDIHSYVASVVFSIPVEDVDKTRRNIAKMVSYGLVYGMEAFGLAERLTISVTEAKEILVKYFASFPALKSFIEDSIVEAKVNGYVKTILGRRRNFDELNSMDRMHRMAMERQAANSIIQGSAADLFKMAIIRLNSKLKSTNIDAALVLQIHDELIVECIANQIDETIPIVKAEMESVGELGIPLTLHLNTGFSWAEKRG